MIISAFFLAYSLTQLVGGYLVDRLGTRSVLTSAVGIWSLGTIACGAVGSAMGLAVSRALVGMGEAVFPAGSSVAITDNFKKESMARPKSVIQSGASVGFAVGSLVTTALIAYFNWRVMFVTLGLIGLVLSILLYLVMKPKVRTAPVSAGPKATKSEKARITALLKNSLTWKIALCYFFTNIVFWGLQSWLPSYWVKVKGMSMMSMGAYSAIPPAVGFLSFLFSGWLLDRYFHKKEKYVICIGALVSAVFIYLMAYTTSIPLAFFYLTVSNVFLNAISISVFVTIMKHYPSHSVGTATGLINSLAQIGSFASPTAIGAILHATDQNYQTAFLAIIGCAVVTLAVAATLPTGSTDELVADQPIPGLVK
jgi:MFS family permease